MKTATYGKLRCTSGSAQSEKKVILMPLDGGLGGGCSYSSSRWLLYCVICALRWGFEGEIEGLGKMRGEGWKCFVCK